jgi:rhamnosyltransferase
MPKVSIIMRLKNEAEFLSQVLDALERQTFKDFEIIAIDNASTDNTAEILNQYQYRLKINIHYLPAEKFTYPYACNFGAEKATGEIIGFLGGHSIPVFDDYLESNLKHFEDPKVAGVYGYSLPGGDATFIEWLFYTGGKGYHWSKAILAGRKPREITKMRLGILGNTGSLLRKSLWQEHKFDEKLTKGGEDAEWAGYQLKIGNKIIRDGRMSVKHSHDLSFFRFLKQYFRWQKVNKQARKELA